ncbi:aldehyde dehydrogenase (NAD(P)(+)) ald5 [Pleurotus pulmonarius]|nr:aldehyde dehydrogenase (NAD(P)(+)) ald5 [Pleurotus pulmonarius]
MRAPRLRVLQLGKLVARVQSAPTRQLFSIRLLSTSSMAQSTVVKIPSSGKEITVPTGLFINNEFVPSIDSNEFIKPVNPATEEAICSVVAGSVKDIDVAVAAAREAFKTTWGKNVTGFERSRLINKLADLIERDAQELAELETLNNGKPVKIARSWKVAPALACGCTIVMKPSEVTPLTALKLCELVKEAGFPPGVINTVPSLGSIGGAALAAHPDVDKVAFTGSTVTGRKIMEAAKGNIKKVSLELGGKSPHIIFESADLDQAANWVALGIGYNTGQDCTAGSRLYVQDTIYDKFVTLLVGKMKELVVGNGFDDASGAGPVVSKTQYDRVWSYIEAGKQAGAKVAIGGEKRQGKGYFVDPTIFTDITSDMKIIFGPVLTVGRFKTEEEAISLANDTTYGLGAGLHSNDASQCIRVSSALEAGTVSYCPSEFRAGAVLMIKIVFKVWINQYNILNNNVPFGGKKQSGIGNIPLAGISPY